MAVTYPLAASAFWEQLRFAGRPEFKPLFRERQSEDGGGNALTAFLGSPKWTAEVALEGGRHNANMTQEVDLHQLCMRAGTFLAYDIRRPYPASDAGGVLLDNGSLLNVGDVAASGNTATGAYTVEGVSVGLSTAVTVAGDAGNYWDGDGILRTSASNALRVNYGPLANLLNCAYLRDFSNASWAKSRLTVSADAAVAPDGTTSADTLLETATTGGHYVEWQTIKAKTNADLCWSIFVKAAGRSRGSLIVYGSDTANSIQANFNFSTGAVESASNAGTGSGAAGTITAVGDGWFRLQVTGKPSSADTGSLSSCRFIIRDGTGASSYTGDTSLGVYVWAGMLSYGLTAPTFPRSPLGVRAETAFTNLLLYSDEIDNAAWTKMRTTVTANAAVAPDGTTTADKVVESVTAGASYVASSFTFTAQAYVGSVFLKAGEKTQVRLQITDTGGVVSGADVTVDLVSGAVSSGTGTIQDCGNGWHRVSVTGTPAAGAGSLRVLLAGTELDDGTSGLYVWGGQLETGSVAHSYVKTTSATVSRAADALSFKAAGVNDFTIALDNGTTQGAQDVSGNWAPLATSFNRPHIRSWSATRDTQPSASTVQIKSKGSNNRSLALKGLPKFYRITKGDKLSILYSTTKRFLFEAVEGVTADISGETAEFEISPYMPPGIAVNDAVTLKKPCGKFKLVADSYRAASGRGNISDGVGFSMISVP